MEHSADNKLTARERLGLLFDEGTFLELDSQLESDDVESSKKKNARGDGVITGFGMIKNRKVFVFAQDFTFMGGSLGEKHADKIIRLYQMALRAKKPIIGLFDSVGARIQEGVRSLAGFGRLFRCITMASGAIPQIAVVLGPCAGGSVYAPALMDYIFMVESSSQMFLTGPRVIETVTGEKIDANELGGACVHTEISGVAHGRCGGERECLEKAKELLDFLPDHFSLPPQKVFCGLPVHAGSQLLNTIVPDSPKKGYNIYEVINQLCDGGYFELHDTYAKNIVTCLGRVDGKVVGVIANNPSVLAGCMDIKSSQKLAAFIRKCDAFNIPLITLVDTPGFLPGRDQEYGGVIRHGSAVLFAYSEASVPKITIIMRKAYGGGYIAMCSKGLGADMVYAWPSAEVAVMGPEGAVKILHRKELKDVPDTDTVYQQYVEEYKKHVADPHAVAKTGHIDEVILPGETRGKIILSLEMLQKAFDANSQKKHGNIPL